jgi:Sulfotransferase domain
MTLPNFLIVGAAKCGTTSLYHHLRQHPQIFMPDLKEPMFFMDWEGGVVSLKDYRALFDNAQGEKAIGEASTAYLYAEEAPGRIKELLGNIKIIMILRNPADRAYSHWHYLFEVRKRGEKLPFKEALKREPERMKDPAFRNQRENWHTAFYYFNRGLYYNQVKRYYEHFGKENVLIHIFEDFKTDPLKTCRETFSFLGVDPDFIPEFKWLNVGNVRHSGLHKLLHNSTPFQARVTAALPKKAAAYCKDLLTRLNAKPTLDKRLRKELLARYEPDVKKLSELIERDLSHWLAG